VDVSEAASWPQITRSRGVSESAELLRAIGHGAFQEGVGTLLELDAVVAAGWPASGGD
jgi:hypothetical protein